MKLGYFFFYKAREDWLVGWFVFVLKKIVQPYNGQGVFPCNLGYSEINGRKYKRCAQNLATWRACSYISCLVGVEAVDNTCNLARNQFAEKLSGKMLTFLGFHSHFQN